MIYTESQWAILDLNRACVQKWIHKPRKFWVECYPKICDFRTLLVVFGDFNDTKSTKIKNIVFVKAILRQKMEKNCMNFLGGGFKLAGGFKL